MGLLTIQNSLCYFWIFCQFCHVVTAQTYTKVTSIINDKITNSGYNPEVRPLVDQSKTIVVDVWFELVSIVEVNDVAQSFTCNGFLLFGWKDELIVWDPQDYGGHKLIHPLPEQIWRPMVLLLNTLDKRDLFDDDKSPVFIYNSGDAIWAPGSVFPVSCQLTMTNYPFDQQECVIHMTALTLNKDEMQFKNTVPTIGTSFYTLHGEWDLLSASIITSNLSSGVVQVPTFQLKFNLKRKPIFLIINIILPVVFLSFLNILVFVIPVESGEKIGYGITVLLALTVFMSIVMGMLPRSSRSMPNVTIYLFILLIISMLTVIDCIVIVFLSHREERERVHLDAKRKFKEAFSKVKNSVAPQNNETSTSDNKVARKKITLDRAVLSFTSGSQCEEKPEVNKYKLIGKYMDKVSFVVFMFIWISVTLGFLIFVSQS